MAEAAGYTREMTEDVEQLRLLADVNQIRANLRVDGTLDETTRQELEVDYLTAVYEGALPSVVSPTIQRVEHQTEPDGQRKRLVTWLGRSAVDVALSGYKFYTSHAGRLRGEVEVAEAHFSQESLTPGVAQVFISPQMSRSDASVEVAKTENLFGQDAIRVSKAITDSSGNITARRIDSLLVSDVSLEDWVAMLKDAQNLFGTAFELEDESSALSVMKLFNQFGLSETMLPEGPVSILEGVLPYITNPVRRARVSEQLQNFRSRQAEYQELARTAAARWMRFDIELARSLEQGTATGSIEAFIGSMQHNFSEKDVAVINAHDVAGDYIMTEQLAALLEKAQKYLVISQVSLAADNRGVIKQTDTKTAQYLKSEINFLAAMQSHGADPREIAARQARLDRALTRQNFNVGGGCGSRIKGDFHTDGDDSNEEQSNESSENSSNWSWKKGVCRVRQCPSPQPTEVGPCNVCRNCQHRFDQGDDPTSGPTTVRPKQVGGFNERDIWKYFYEQARIDRDKPPEAVPSPQRRQQTGTVVLAAMAR